MILFFPQLRIVLNWVVSLIITKTSTIQFCGWLRLYLDKNKKGTGHRLSDGKSWNIWHIQFICKVILTNNYLVLISVTCLWQNRLLELHCLLNYMHYLNNMFSSWEHINPSYVALKILDFHQIFGIFKKTTIKFD